MVWLIIIDYIMYLGMVDSTQYNKVSIIIWYIFYVLLVCYRLK